MTELRLDVEGMTCVNCAKAIDVSLGQLKGVSKVKVSFELGKVWVTYDPHLLSQEDLKMVIESLGYKVISTVSARDWNKPILIFCGIGSLTIMILMHLSLPLADGLQFFISTLIQGIGGYRFYRGAYHSLKLRLGNMDVLVSLGSTGAYLYSVLIWWGLFPGKPFFETSAFLITFVRLGKYLEERFKIQAFSLLKDLFSLQTSKVFLLTPQGGQEVLVKDLRPGDLILLKPGSIVPVDGEIFKGKASVDESLVSGESLPVVKGEGRSLLSGSLILDGTVEMRVAKDLNQSFLALLLKQVEEALQEKPRVQRLADLISHYFVQAVLIVSWLVFSYWYFTSGDPTKGFNFALAVLVISCPCAFGLAIPLAVSIGLIRSYGRGVVIKKPEAFERASHLRAIILDKTGTLTQGRPEITKFKPYLPVKEALDLAFSIASLSDHPYSKAVVKYAQGQGAQKRYTFKEAEEIPGIGLRADGYFLGRKQGKQALYLLQGEKVLAEFYPEDKLRPQAKEVIQYLQNRGLEVFLLSGDSLERVKRVAQELGLTHWIGEVKPQEKLVYLKRIEEKYGPTAMVGDGLNDAPALAKAYLSFVMGEGIDLSKRVGDVILLSGIQGLREFFKVAEKTSLRIKQNLFWAFLYNLLGIPIAAGALSQFGLTLKPELSGLLMVVSSLSVVLNSIRR